MSIAEIALKKFAIKTDNKFIPGEQLTSHLFYAGFLTGSFLPFINVRTILNFSNAFSSWGEFAGIIIVSPALRIFDIPLIIISALPSTICTTAS